MRKYYLLGASLAIIIGSFFIFQGKPDYQTPTVGENIIIFGDSLAFGQGSTPGNDRASLLNRKTGLPVINAGVNGDTTVSALPRVEFDVLTKNPKVVIILLGGNDFLQRVPETQTINSIRAIVETIQSKGVGIILVNENKILGTRSEFEDLAKEKNIPYIENALGGIINDNQLMADQIHPNDKGYEILAEKIRPVLVDYLD
jgi:acyl-CoA thioesterase I